MGAEHKLLDTAQKLRSAFDRQLISADEFVENVADHLMNEVCNDHHIAAQLIELVPDAVRPCFVSYMESCLQQGYAARVFHGVPMTDQQVAVQREANTERIQGWANAVLSQIPRSAKELGEQ